MKYFILFFLLSIVVACSAQLGSTINFRGDWETGQLTGVGNWAGVESVRPNVSIQLVTDNVRQGKYAARFEVTTDDFIHFGERAEVSAIRNATGGIDRAENIPGNLKLSIVDLCL